MLKWYQKIAVRIYRWEDEEYNWVGISPPDTYSRMPVLVICGNRAYKTYEELGMTRKGVLLPLNLIRDLLVKRMRQSIKDGDEDLFGPDGDYWNRECTVADAQFIMAEIGKDLPITFSWRNDCGDYQECEGTINLLDVAAVQPQFTFKALHEAKAQFKK